MGFRASPAQIVPSWRALSLTASGIGELGSEKSETGPGISAQPLQETPGLLFAQVVQVGIGGDGLHVVSALVLVVFADPGPNRIPGFGFGRLALALGPLGIGSLFLFGQFLPPKGNR